MNKSIVVGLVALGLVACGAKEEAVVVEEAAPAAEVVAEEVPAADTAEIPAEGVTATAGEAPVAVE